MSCRWWRRGPRVSSGRGAGPVVQAGWPRPPPGPAPGVPATSPVAFRFGGAAPWLVACMTDCAWSDIRQRQAGARERGSWEPSDLRWVGGVVLCVTALILPVYVVGKIFGFCR